MIAQEPDTPARHGPRLRPVEPPFAPDVATTLERLMGAAAAEPLLLFRTIAHHPVLLDKLRTTGTYLLNFGTVDPIEREIVILRTCARCGCEYEWGVHVAIFASSVGLTDEQVRSTVIDDPTRWSERQQALIDLVDQLHDTGTVTDELWERLVCERRPDQLVELVTLVGQYHNVSFAANALGVDLEPFAARFAGYG